ncbi:MAG: VTT domain-containing protein [Nanoarchaeota archaeon]|nr:VTT domain-containing protein [Nanoarchaeota archaeon]MBU1135837.1 VTT domain-containing protein [Nanoarchaeota archaeon]MBU2519657.1 VTT domain-containing protein [Nanoarchaeota archaeon]
MVDLVNTTSQFIVWAQGTVEVMGYFGVFIISLVGSASIILPIPAFIVVFAAGGFLNPWAVGIFAGLGSAIGELTGYGLGMGGRELLARKYGDLLIKTRNWVEKRGAFIIIIVFALTPLPDDVIGILAGMINYDIKKFFMATLIGKIILNVAIALAGFYGMNWLFSVITLSG